MDCYRGFIVYADGDGRWWATGFVEPVVNLSVKAKPKYGDITAAIDKIYAGLDVPQ